MPTIKNKRAAKKALRATGLSKKAARKTLNKQIRDLNGGKSKLGRLWRGGLKAVANVIPGVGGALAGALLDGSGEKVDASTLPIFNKDVAAQNTATTIADAANKQAIDTTAVKGGTISEVPINNFTAMPPPPPLQTTQAPQQSIGEASQMQSSGGGYSGGGGYQEEEEQEEAPQRRSFAPTSKDAKDKEKDKNKTLYIVIGAVVGLAVLAFVFKALNK